LGKNLSANKTQTLVCVLLALKFLKIDLPEIYLFVPNANAEYLFLGKILTPPYVDNSELNVALHNLFMSTTSEPDKVIMPELLRQTLRYLLI